MHPALNILYEDNHLLVVVKPSMLPTQGIAESESSAVIQLKDYLRHKWSKPGNVYLGVVSRLDAWVSGVIVFAKTSKAAARLNQQFRSRTCRKTYLALVPDQPALSDSGILENWLSKNESTHRMEVRVPGETERKSACKKGDYEKALHARLAYETLSRRGGIRVLGIELGTGRKHQIRVQLAAAGCPLLGDRKYGSQRDFPIGIALHSFRLQITHPTTKEPLEFKAAPPDYWQLERFNLNWTSI
jgi:23S rRNA pseudouridine1911/1915/1917 synthase